MSELMSQHEYVKNGGNLCPVCRSTEIESGCLDGDGADAWASTTCAKCGHSWTDFYRVTGYGDLNDPEGERVDVPGDDPGDIATAKEILGRLSAECRTLIDATGLEGDGAGGGWAACDPQLTKMRALVKEAEAYLGMA